jgi:hypothetical protein
MNIIDEDEPQAEAMPAPGEDQTQDMGTATFQDNKVQTPQVILTH